MGFMISFNLTCDQGHIFEGWFGSSDDYDDQQRRGLVSCPHCNSTAVKKALMTPNVTAKSNQRSSASPHARDHADMLQDLAAEASASAPSTTAPSPSTPPAQPSGQPQMAGPQVTAQMSPEMQEMMGQALAEMRKFQKTVETNCDDVGDGFATEARKIHYGEAEPRGIYGRTTDKEAEDLVDEGIAITKMPWLPKEH